MKKIIYYIDMDGVLAKWNSDASEEDTHQKGYFRSREAELPVIAMVRMLIKSGAEVSILSSVYQDDHSAEEKREWLDLVGLSDVNAIFVPYGEDKDKYIDESDDTFPVLVDDYSKNLYAWEKKGHLPIKFFNGINNQPKFSVKDGIIQVKTDSWSGYSIDSRMSVKQMFTLLTSVSMASAE